MGTLDVAEIGRLTDQAQQHRRRQAYAEEAAAYRRLAVLDPANPRWPYLQGLAHQRLGDAEAALRSFGQGIEAYMAQGGLLQAITLCKMVLCLDPEHQRTRDILATLSQHPQVLARTGAAPLADGGEDRPPAVVRGDGPAPPAAAPPPADDAPLEQISLTQTFSGASPFELVIDTSSLPGASPPAETGPDGLLERLPPVPLLSSLDQAALRHFAQRVEVELYEAGDAILTQGTPGDALYILVQGEVTVLREGPEPVVLGQLRDGAFFGEMALLSDLQRSATVRADGDCTVLRVSREVVNGLIARHPEVLMVLLAFFRERLIANLMETHELFRPFAARERRALVDRFSFVEAPPGMDLLQQRQHALALFVVVCGQVEVLRDGQRVHVLGGGELFGKYSLLMNAPSAHTVRTVGKCWLLQLGQAAFRELIMTHPVVLELISRGRQTGSLKLVEPGLPWV